MRCLHEASLHPRNSFVTLTYDDDHLPERSQLNYPDFQKFVKRLRWHSKQDIRFYMCGEYGPENFRPHYHAVLFNWDAPDKRYWSSSGAGEKVYRSDTLDRLWGLGFTSVGAVTFQSAAYVARYCLQKVTGHNAKHHYARSDANGPYQLPPEFNHMSLKPGIGARWLQKWQSDVYPHDYVVINGVETKPPKYYDKLFEASNPDQFEEMKFKREQEGRSRYPDNTIERLAVKEKVTEAKISQLVRNAL